MPDARLLFFAGSARQDSLNKKVARLGSRIAEANGIDATFLDLADYPMPLYDGDHEAANGVPESAVRLADQIHGHHGVMIAAPEYNAGISPLLKNSLDWVTRVKSDGADYKAMFRSKVFALASASPGGTGGMRGLFTVRHVLEYGLGALVLPDQFLLPRAGQAFDENGHLADKDAQERFKDLIARLSHATRALGHSDG